MTRSLFVLFITWTFWSLFYFVLFSFWYGSIQLIERVSTCRSFVVLTLNLDWSDRGLGRENWWCEIKNNIFFWLRVSPMDLPVLMSQNSWSITTWMLVLGPDRLGIRSRQRWWVGSTWLEMMTRLSNKTAKRRNRKQWRRSDSKIKTRERDLGVCWQMILIYVRR